MTAHKTVKQIGSRTVNSPIFIIIVSQSRDRLLRVVSANRTVMRTDTLGSTACSMYGLPFSELMTAVFTCKSHRHSARGQRRCKLVTVPIRKTTFKRIAVLRGTDVFKRNSGEACLCSILHLELKAVKRSVARSVIHAAPHKAYIAVMPCKGIS